MTRGRRWYRHPRYRNEAPPIDYRDVQFYGPYLNRHDTWVGLFWDYNDAERGVRGMLRLFLVLFPCVVLRVDVDLSFSSRAFRRRRDGN